MYRTPVRLLLVLLLWLSLVPASIAGQPLKVGIYNFEPLLSTSAEGQPRGLFIDVFDHIAAAEHWEVRYVPGTWRDSLARLEAGEIDLLLAIGYSEERAQRFDYTRNELFLDWGMMYVRPGSPIRNILDLRGKKVSCLAGSIYTEGFQRLAEQFRLNVTLVPRNEYAQVMRDVETGQADAGIATNVNGLNLEAKYEIERTAIVFSPVRIMIAARKGAHVPVIAAIDRHIAELKGDRTSLYHQKYNEWLGVRSHALPRWVRWTGISLTATLAGLALFAAALRRQVRLRTAALQSSANHLLESEQRFRALFEQAGTGVAQIDTATGRFVRVNRRYGEITGRGPDDMSHFTIQSITHADDLALDQAHLQRLIAGEIRAYSLEMRYVRADGSLLWVASDVAAMWEPGEEPNFHIAVVQDITARKQAEETLQLAATVFESTAESVVITDGNATILSVNKAFTETTGYAAHEVVGHNPRLLQSEHQPADFYRQMWHALRVQGHWRGEIWNRRKDGEVYPVWLTISAVTNERGEVKNYVGVSSDISALKRSQADLDRLAHYDPLTGLPNRVLFGARLEHALDSAQRQRNRLAVLLLDLDGFKTVNDSLGHPVGDELLQRVAERVTGCTRSDDTVARLGGDEFALVLENLHQGDDALGVVDKILRSLQGPFDLQGGSALVTGSIGIAVFPEDGTGATELVRNADTALYRSKEGGRNTYRFYQPEMTRAAQEKLNLERALRRALARSELEVWYQPQVDAHSGRLWGVEALVRWRDPERGLIPPNDFIPLAESTGLIVTLGEQVLYAACRQARRWSDEGVPFGRVAVNIAGIQIDRSDLVATLDGALVKHGLETKYLELELTESLVMKAPEEAAEIMRGFRQFGLRLSLDDFGTGYSSLSYLKMLPIDKLKIDRSFVRDLPDDPNDVSIARSVISLGRNLGFRVVAEGVETCEQVDFLRSEGCDALQGYLYARPMPPAEFESWAKAREEERQLP